MLDVNRLLGVEGIFEDPALMESFKREIMSRVRFTTPGYGCDYYLRTFDNGIEFDLCRGLDGSDRGVAVHFSGRLTTTLTLNHIISAEGSSHIYNMYCDDPHDSFDVRIVCPDVLAYPKAGDRIFGQLEAISSGSISVCDAAEVRNTDGFVTGIENGKVLIAGRVCDVEERYFVYEDISEVYYETTVETDIGKLPIVIRKKDASEPIVGQFLRSEAVLSFDVGVARNDYVGMDLYENAAFSSEYRLGCGFVPNHGNAVRLVEGCAQHRSFSRLRRACAESVAVMINGRETSVANADIGRTITSLLPPAFSSAVTKHIVSCKSQDLLGLDAVAVSSGNTVSAVIVPGVDRFGFIDRIEFADPTACELGYDHELHALSMLSYEIDSQRADLLREFLSDDCYYRSEYADRSYAKKERIIRHLNAVADALDDTNRYSHKLVPAADALRTQEDLPKIYCGRWCSVVYQGGKLAYVMFICLNEYGEISNILLSRNGNYLKAFETAGSSVPVKGSEPVNVKELLEDCYGHEKPVDAMRAAAHEGDDRDVYVWREADAFAFPWLRDLGYTVTATVLEEDCIGYACTRKGKDVAVYVYAYGRQKTTPLDAEYCRRLKDYPLSRNRMIIIVYLQVELKIGDNGENVYQVGHYGDSSDDPEMWILKEVNGKDIILYYPGAEIYEMIPRLMAAFNTQNLDVLKAICAPNIYLEWIDGARTMNDGFYGNLSALYRKYGEMRTAYVRYNDVVYATVPYLDGFCYISFSLTGDTGRICAIIEKPLDNSYRDLIITDESPESDPLNEYPLLRDVQFLPASDVARFSARLTFENGEIRRYNFKAASPQFVTENAPEEDAPDQAEVSLIDHSSFTDKMFRHGRIVEHLDLPGWTGYRTYPRRGQGLVFVNGYTISTAELYFNSYPIEEFSYAGMSGVFVSNRGYAEDGFGVGRISGLDPENPYYLLNSNTMIAKVLPKEYQNTPMVIYPSCGGYSEGLVMVSTLGDIDLQYHHNMRGCAGMWGWLDKNLKEVIAPQYVFAKNFANGRAVVCKGEWLVDDEDRYWCEHEQWGVINTVGEEVVPCMFDELYGIGNTDRLYFVHTGGWKEGHCAVYDVETQRIILDLDFDYDPGYMFNECFVADGGILVFDVHLPGEGKDLITAYDLHSRKYLLHQEENTGRTFHGQKTLTVKNEETGMDIIVF